jgi:hypothetical protein
MIESVRSEKGPENEGTPFPLWMEQSDLTGRGWDWLAREFLESQERSEAVGRAVSSRGLCED